MSRADDLADDLIDALTAELTRPLGVEALAHFEHRVAGSASDRAEALRRLGIALEGDGARWAELAPVFRRAVELAPGDYRVQLSHAIAALASVESDGHDEAIMAEGRRAADAAAHAATDPADRAHAAYCRGLLEYHGGTAPARCLPWFEQALVAAPAHPMYQLHVAECLHEMRDWPRAVVAWRTVDAAALARGWGRWRETRRRSRLIVALAEAGAYRIAHDGLITLLGELEGLDPEARAERVCDLWDLDAVSRRYFPAEHSRVVRLGSRLNREPYRAPHSGVSTAPTPN